MFVLRNETIVVREHLGVLRLKTRPQIVFNYCFPNEIRISISDILVSHGLTMVFIADRKQQKLYLVTCKMDTPVDFIVVRELAVPRFNEQWLDVCHTNCLVVILNSESKLTAFEWKLSKEKKPILHNIHAVSTIDLHTKAFVIPETMQMVDVPIASRLLTCNECVYLLQTVTYRDTDTDIKREKENGEEDPDNSRIFVHTIFSLERILGEYTLIPKFSFSSVTPLSFVYATAMDQSDLVGTALYRVSLKDIQIIIRFIMGDHIVDLDCRSYKCKVYMLKNLATRIENTLFKNEKYRGMPYIFSKNEILLADFSSFELFRNLSAEAVSSTMANLTKKSSSGDVCSISQHSVGNSLSISVFNKRLFVPEADLVLDFDTGADKDQKTMVPKDNVVTSAILPTVTPLGNTDSVTTSEVSRALKPSITMDDSLHISSSTSMTISSAYNCNTDSNLQPTQLQLSHEDGGLTHKVTTKGSLSRNVTRVGTPQDDSQTSLTLRQLKSLTATDDVDASAVKGNEKMFMAAIGNMMNMLQTLIDRQAATEAIMMQELSTYRHAHEYLDLRLARLEGMIEALCNAEGFSVDPCSGIPAAFVPTDGLYDPGDPAEPFKVRRVQDSRELREIRELRELQICDSVIDSTSKSRTGVIDEVRGMCENVKRLLATSLSKIATAVQQKTSVLSDAVPVSRSNSRTSAQTSMTSSMPPLPPRSNSALNSAHPPRAPAALKPSSSYGDLSMSLPVASSFSLISQKRVQRTVNTPSIAEFNESLDRFIATYTHRGPVISSPSIPAIQKTGNYLSLLFTLVNPECYLAEGQIDPSSDSINAFQSFNPDTVKHMLLTHDDCPTILTTMMDSIEFIQKFFGLNVLDLVFDTNTGLGYSVDDFPFLYILQQSMSTISICRKNNEPEEDDPPPTRQTIFDRETKCLTELMCDEEIDETHKAVVESGLINPIVLQMIRANPFIKQIPSAKLIQFLEIVYVHILMKWNKKLEQYIIKLMKPLFCAVFPQIFVKNTTYASQILNVPISCKYMDLVWMSCLQYIHLFVHQLQAVPPSDASFYEKSATDNTKALTSPAWRDSSGTVKVQPIFT